MNTYARRKPVIAAFVLLSAASAPLLAQATHQQTIELRPGWSSVFLEVAPAEPAIETVFGTPNCSVDPVPIQSVWTYDTHFGRVGTIVDPAQGLINTTGWFGWFAPNRPETVLNTLFGVQVNRAYLVKLGGTQTVTCTIDGAPRRTTQSWIPDSFNLVGFPVDPDAPPTFDTWFASSSAHDGEAIFRLDASGHWQAVQAAFETINPGEAYWVWSHGASSYQGPLEVDIEGQGLLEFGPMLDQRTVILRNHLDVDTAVTVDSTTATLPLKYEYVDEATHQQAWADLPSSHSVVVASEDETLLTLAPDRTAFADRAEEILEIRNGLGSRLLLLVGANTTQVDPTDRAGLWVGNVWVRKVGAARCLTSTESRCYGSTLGLPDEVQDVRMQEGPPEITWADQGPDFFYDVVGESLDSLHVVGTDTTTCLADDLTQAEWTDTREDPAEAEGYYYLVRAETAEYGGDLGTSSAGDPRAAPSACPVAEECTVEDRVQVLIGQCHGGTNDGESCDAELASRDCPGGACLYCEPVDPTPTPVRDEFALRMLVHVDDTGQARLLKEVIQMFDPPCQAPDPENPGYSRTTAPGRYVLITDEDLVPSFDGVALRDGRLVGARLSTAAFDFDATSGAGWDDTAKALRMEPPAAFGQDGATLTVDLLLGSNFPTNPFRHPFHPDHDNLASDYLTPVDEAPAILRRIELTFEDDHEALDPGEGRFAEDPRWGADAVGGYYREEITGLHRQPLVVEGKLLLRRLEDSPDLNPSPQSCP